MLVEGGLLLTIYKRHVNDPQQHIFLRDEKGKVLNAAGGYMLHPTLQRTTLDGHGNAE